MTTIGGDTARRGDYGWDVIATLGSDSGKNRALPATTIAADPHSTPYPRVDQVAHFPLFPILSCPWQHLIGVNCVEAEYQSPAGQRSVEPRRPGRHGIDQEQDKVDDDVGRKMAVERSQGANPSPCPFFDLGDASGFPNADSRPQLDWFTILPTDHHLDFLPLPSLSLNVAAALASQSLVNGSTSKG